MNMSALAAACALALSAPYMRITLPIAVALLCAKSMGCQVSALKAGAGAINDTPKTTHKSD
jgi:hypothetical protein